MRLLVLSALFLASALQTAFGQPYVTGDFVYTLSNNQVTITRYMGTGDAVTIPAYLNFYPVVSIGQQAFEFSTFLTSVTIPNSVTSIGANAFTGCGLTYVSIGNSVTSIGGGAFADCPNLTYVSIGNSVTSIGGGAFYGCIGLTSVTIPNSVTSIGNNAFEGCFALTSITIPNSVTSIGTDAFTACTRLGVVTLPERFATTYTDFGLTASQVYFYDPSSTSYLAGRQSVLQNPNSHSLYTTSQIQNMAVGDLVLTKNADGSFTLNYDIEKSEDLQTWTTYAPLSLTLTNLPPDKAFIRIASPRTGIGSHNRSY